MYSGHVGPSHTFSVPQQVVHETLDGEVILINLENGNYYSLRDSGSVIWALLGAGHPVGEIGAALSTRFGIPAEEAEQAVAELARALHEEGLLDTPAAAPAAGPVVSLNGDIDAFRPPVFERYTDMQDFILLDPVHDTGPAGWPQAAAQ